MASYWRELGEGERSATVELLEYIAQYGSIEGIEDILPKWTVSPIRKLLELGYVQRVGKREYELTSKAWQYLGGETPLRYERTSPTEEDIEQVRAFQKKRRALYQQEEEELAQGLQGRGIDTEGYSKSALWNLRSLLMSMGEEPVGRHEESFKTRLQLQQEARDVPLGAVRRGYRTRRREVEDE